MIYDVVFLWQLRDVDWIVTLETQVLYIWMETAVGFPLQFITLFSVVTTVDIIISV